MKIMKTLKVLLCSRNPVYGVSGGQENRLDVTNPHTERFFWNMKNRSAVGVWYRLNRILPRNRSFDWDSIAFDNRTTVIRSRSINVRLVRLRFSFELVRLTLDKWLQKICSHPPDPYLRLNRRLMMIISGSKILAFICMCLKAGL